MYENIPMQAWRILLRLALLLRKNVLAILRCTDYTKKEMRNIMARKLIFATNNQGKVNEIRQILGEGYDVYSLKDLDIHTDIVEDGASFEENAVIKAKAICEETGEMVLADDSGFEVDYLNGEPGIYLGEETSYDIKNADLLRRCEAAQEGERTARFVCVIACAYPDGRIDTTRGVIEGVLAHEPKGTNGFGYDPIFYLPERGCTTGELEPEEKNRISHRGIALRKMVEKLK